MSLRVFSDNEVDASPNNEDTRPRSALEHASLLHPTGAPGTVVLAHKDGDRWPHLAVAPRDLPDAIRSFKQDDDLFITFARFRSRYRRIAHLGQLTAVFSDLDYYKKPALADRTAGWVMEAACRHLEDEHLPLPTFAVGTGRGVLLAWLHEPVPRAALPRWNEAQRQISEALRDFGADAMCMDAARLTRLIGSRNSKSGRLVEALIQPEPAWDFDRLMDEVLPFTRAEWAAQHRDSEGKRIVPVRRLTAATLWEARLADLQRLRELRFFGPLPPGQRDVWMFVAGTGMSWLVETPSLERELIILGREVTDDAWSATAIRSHLSTVIRRAMDAAKGCTVEFHGLRIDSRYRLTSGWIVNALGIAREEQAEMRTLIDDDVRQERHRDNTRALRRQAGVIPREDYERQAAERVTTVVSLRGQGMSVRKIAATIGLSSSHVGRLVLAAATSLSETESRSVGSFASIHQHTHGTPTLAGLSSERAFSVASDGSLDEYTLLLDDDAPPLAETAAQEVMSCPR